MALLRRRSKVMLGCIFIIFIGAGIAGAIMMSGKYAYASFTASWFCLFSLFMTYAMSSTLPKVRSGNLFPSDDVFPVYEWDPARKQLISRNTGVVAAYAALLLAMMWAS